MDREKLVRPTEIMRQIELLDSTISRSGNIPADILLRRS